MKFENGVIGILETNWLTPYKKRQLDITGVDGIISIDYIDQSVKVYGKNAQKVKVDHKEPLKEELNSFLSAVTNDEEPKITGEDGVHALKVVLAAMKSAKHKIPVNMNEC